MPDVGETCESVLHVFLPHAPVHPPAIDWLPALIRLNMVPWSLYDFTVKGPACRINGAETESNVNL